MAGKHANSAACCCWAIGRNWSTAALATVLNTITQRSQESHIRAIVKRCGPAVLMKAATLAARKLEEGPSSPSRGSHLQAPHGSSGRLLAASFLQIMNVVNLGFLVPDNTAGTGEVHEHMQGVHVQEPHLPADLMQELENVVLLAELDSRACMARGFCHPVRSSSP